MGDVPIDIHVDKAQAWLEDRSSKSSRLRSLRNLVEPAKFLVAATEYELPALVRKTERVYLQIKDSLSKEEEYGKRADAARRRSAAACEEWDLRTEDLESGEPSRLCKNLKALPVLFDAVVKDIKVSCSPSFASGRPFAHRLPQSLSPRSAQSGDVGTAVEFYGKHDGALETLGEILAPEQGECCISLATATSALSDDPSTLAVAAEEPSISWDLGTAGGDSEGGEPTVSWDIGVEAGGVGEEVGPAVSWDIGGAEAGSEAGGEPTVSWDIEVTEKAEEDPAVCWDIGVAEAGAGGEEEIAEEECGEVVDALVSKLASLAFKQKLLDDLFELSAFLGQRLAEGENGHFLTDSSDISLDVLKVAVDSAIAKLTSGELERLESLRSARTRDKIMRDLQQKHGQEAKYREMIAAAGRRREVLQRESLGLRPQLRELVDKTKQLKQSVEGAISRLYDNRPVHIIGKINKALADAEQV